MPIKGIKQPEFLSVSNTIRLRKFDDKFHFAFPWYQDLDAMYYMDGTREAYSMERITRMYQYLYSRGELYFIEALENGTFIPIGDVTFWQEDMPMIIGVAAYRGKGIGRAVVSALIQRGKKLGYDKLYVNEIYDFNLPSQRCYQSVGFVPIEKTERGHRYCLNLTDDRKYYYAYDDRYQQIHGQNLQWFFDTPSPIVMETIRDFSVAPEQKLLEIGCGEGRDAFLLLKEGFDLLATDVSREAIDHCQKTLPDYACQFQILDCITQTLPERFDFIYAVAVLHMLVCEEDRKGFYAFIREHLNADGIGLICTMGNGTSESCSDIRTAFTLQERIHQQTGIPVKVAGTSCRMVSFPTFRQELEHNGLVIIKEGFTSAEPDFSQMMYAVVRRI